MRTLRVFINAQQVGTLAEADSLWRFDYDETWGRSPQGFDLSPALPRRALGTVDGASMRPVQWYFDNLLPEERLREAVAKEAALNGDDAFALLEYLGLESAGSLTLLPEERDLPAQGALQPLSDATVSQRIRHLPRETLGRQSPKRMSLAGAQHKLLVVLRDGQLFEPVAAEPSTHILKPAHPSDDFAGSVANEYFSMRLAAALGLEVPQVWRRYTPEPVYIVERFDRYQEHTGGPTLRRHIIDACQLLNKDRGFKYHGATLESLLALVNLCRNRIATRLRLYRWLVFNLLIGNHDNHLKNLSFIVGPEGIELAPHYDLLSTGVYDTRAMADDRAIWPTTPLVIHLPGAKTFAEVTRQAVLEAGKVLGLTPRIAAREMDRMLLAIPDAMAQVIAQVEAENQAWTQKAGATLAGEMRVLLAIQHIVVPDMVGRCGAGADMAYLENPARDT